ncbi:uridine phosphorylase 1-like [Octopus vulgaris]|nr:uridine phosphorylase 1 [Octopus sinensis]CAI9735365.1 uridine phosphorylase 1-like [Octopus vulgaris]
MATIPNQRIKQMKDDHLFHIGINVPKDDVSKLFGDVKFVCMGGSAKRMAAYARLMEERLTAEGQEPYNYAQSTDRYVLYKVGQVLFVNHGIGIPSLSTVLQEIGKLLFHAGCSDVTFFRLGTSGGIGLDPGTVIISEKVVNWELQQQWNLPVLGKMVHNPAVPNKEIYSKLKAIADSLSLPNCLGTTMCCDDFYEGQGRLDGPFSSFSDEDRDAYLQHLQDKGVTNMEMESVGFVALCNKMNIPCAVICVTVVDRLKGDQITADHDHILQWEKRPIQIFFEYMKKHHLK